VSSRILVTGLVVIVAAAAILLVIILRPTGNRAQGSSSAQVAHSAAPSPAVSGDFYSSAPTGWQGSSVGTILKFERVDPTWPSLNGLTAYRVMYVSRGASDGLSRGGKVFETGMVYIPKTGAAPNGGWPVLAWGHGTSGVGPSSAPSRYGWLYPESQGSAYPNYADFVGKVGKLGAIVACPDYEGLGTPGLHPYLHVESEGRSMIDAVRAARNLAARLGIAASRDWAAAGHSQGGGAAIGAAELATTYGKGLHLRATVAFAPAGAIDVADYETDFTDPNWYPLLAWCAWGVEAIDTTNEFAFGDMLGPWLLPDKQQARGLYADQFFSLVEGSHAAANGDPLTPAMSDIEAKGWQRNPVVKRWLYDTLVGHRQASGPILVVQGTADALYAGLPRLKSQLAAAGDRFRTVLVPGASHDQALTEGWPAAKAFLRANWSTT